MTKNFILSEDPSVFVNTIESDFNEMTSGCVSETDAVDFITKVLPLARACNNNSEFWFWMFDEPETMPSDCRIAYVYEPTYMITGMIMYALTKYESVKNIPGLKDILGKVINGCMGRDFNGQCFYMTEGFLKAMKFFAKANVTNFIKEFGDSFPKFAAFFKEKETYLREEIFTGKVRSEWNDSDYIMEAGEIIKLLDSNDTAIRIFVYGTLMRGQRADCYLNYAKYVGTYRLRDYAMYNLGYYPGIRPCKGESVVGEVYEITLEMLSAMDSYEGEGSLYVRERVMVSNVLSELSTYVYVYNHDVKAAPMRETWGSKPTDRVWYACYGSNLDADRFACYIKGGLCKDNGRRYPGCQRDNSMWTESKIRCYSGKMYFGNRSGSWGGKGVAFFDNQAEGKTIMRLYNISREQLQELQNQEGASENWYGRIVCLDVEEDGCPVYTITSEKTHTENAPAENYYSLIKRALVSQCGLSEEAAKKYMDNSVLV